MDKMDQKPMGPNEYTDSYHEIRESGEIVVQIPITESLLDPNVDQKDLWPNSVVENADFKMQVEARRLLNRSVEVVVSKVSQADMALEHAVDQGIVEEGEVGQMFTSLSDLLDSKLGYERIVLYLPFEFLPGEKWTPNSVELQDATTRFKSSYKQAWHSLLSSHDVRANFVDGDVPELELRDGDLPRVVKAAHLIPMLVEKGILTTQEVFELRDETMDQVLKQNIGEALFVMGDLGLVPQTEVSVDLPVQNHAQPVEVVTERRRAWLEERSAETARVLHEPDENAYRLGAPFSVNMESMGAEMAQIKSALENFELREELFKYIYPMISVCGSRLKGYGRPESDLDLGIFIRPGTDIANTERIRALVQEMFAQVPHIGEPVEFWLEEDGGEIKIKDQEDNPSAVSEYQVELLINSVWEGDADSIEQLRKKMVAPYFSKTDKKIYGQDARGMYLGDLERAALQYRLMHKGYARFFPPCGGVDTQHASRIDGESVFWDSGYRRLATQLFIQRVFLPEISE